MVQRMAVDLNLLEILETGLDYKVTSFIQLFITAVWNSGKILRFPLMNYPEHIQGHYCISC